MQNADMSATLRRCRENSQAELVFIDRLRARECEDDAAGLDLSERNSVESRVALERIAQCVLVLCKSRWIQHNQIVVATGTIEEFESIFGISFVTLVIWEVQLNIGFRESDGLFAGVHTVHAFRAATHGMKPNEQPV